MRAIHRMRMRPAFLLAALLLPASPRAQAQRRAEPGGPLPTIEEKTAALKKLDGFFPLYWQEATGQLWMEIPRLQTEVLYITGLSAGLGSNEVHFFIFNTVNASLGPESPTSFDPGLYRQDEVNVNLRVGYPLNNTVHLAGGLEWRDEKFTIEPQEIADKTGGTYTTLPTTDYFLRPLHPRPGWPYTELWLSDQTTGGFALFPEGFNTVRVVCTRGWAETPEDIEDVALTLAVRIALGEDQRAHLARRVEECTHHARTRPVGDQRRDAGSRGLAGRLVAGPAGELWGWRAAAQWRRRGRAPRAGACRLIVRNP